MKNNLRRLTISSVLLATAGLLLVLAVKPAGAPRHGGLRLAFDKMNPSAANQSGQQALNLNLNVVTPANAPTFGHPIIAGIGGTGFEESIRVDPTLNVNGLHTIYTSAPGSSAADTSWVWHSLDGGKTFKWVVGAAPLEGKVTTC